MPVEKILITVKTYPTLSTKYDELVCTAGFKEDGSWIRIYPIPFRKKSYVERYKKYQWIELDVVKNDKDFRPESYRPVSVDTPIKIIGSIGTENNWKKRKEICLRNVEYSMDKLISKSKNKNNPISLAVFKPFEILDFIIEPTEKEWDKKKLKNIIAKRSQLNLFEENLENTFKEVRKLPYKFFYLFKDIEGKESKLMVEDWELGQLYWNCLKQNLNNEQKALEDVRKKCFDQLAKERDLYFFLGTTMAYHFRSKNPFMIIGLFYPPKENKINPRLFD